MDFVSSFFTSLLTLYCFQTIFKILPQFFLVLSKKVALNYLLCDYIKAEELWLPCICIMSSFAPDFNCLVSSLSLTFWHESSWGLMNLTDKNYYELHWFIFSIFCYLCSNLFYFFQSVILGFRMFFSAPWQCYWCHKLHLYLLYTNWHS